MILHILRFRFKPGTTEEQIAGVVASMHGFAEIPVVDQLLVGQDIAADGYYSHAMIVTVSDVEAMRQYHQHPIHAAADREGLPVIEDIMSFDVSDDLDPALGPYLQEIVAQRMAAQPDIARLAEQLGSHDS